MTKTIKNIMNHCSNLLRNGACRDMPFHNLAHPQELINKVSLSSNAIGIQQKEADFIVIGASFHDSGYSLTYKQTITINKNKMIIEFPKQFALLKGFVILFIGISFLVRKIFLMRNFTVTDHGVIALTTTFITGLVYHIGTISFLYLSVPCMFWQCPKDLSA